MSEENASCIFCNIVQGTTPADIVFQDDESIYFRDISPKAQVHILGIPKNHIASLAQADSEELGVASRILKKLSTEIAVRVGVAESGFRIINNHGRNSGQEVGHLHFHLLGGEPLGPLKCS